MENKRMKRIKIIIGMIVILTILLILGLLIGKKLYKKEEIITSEKYINMLEDGTKLNKSEKIVKARKVDEIEIGPVQLTYKDGITRIIATVTNLSKEAIEVTPIIVTLYDEQYHTLEMIEGVIPAVGVGESEELNMNISTDYANAYDLKIERK